MVPSRGIAALRPQPREWLRLPSPPLTVTAALHCSRTSGVDRSIDVIDKLEGWRPASPGGCEPQKEEAERVVDKLHRSRSPRRRSPRSCPRGAGTPAFVECRAESEMSSDTGDERPASPVEPCSTTMTMSTGSQGSRVTAEVMSSPDKSKAYVPDQLEDEWNLATAGTWWMRCPEMCLFSLKEKPIRTTARPFWVRRNCKACIVPPSRRALHTAGTQLVCLSCKAPGKFCLCVEQRLTPADFAYSKPTSQSDLQMFCTVGATLRLVRSDQMTTQAALARLRTLLEEEGMQDPPDSKSPYLKRAQSLNLLLLKTLSKQPVEEEELDHHRPSVATWAAEVAMAIKQVICMQNASMPKDDDEIDEDTLEVDLMLIDSNVQRLSDAAKDLASTPAAARVRRPLEEATVLTEATGT